MLLSALAVITAANPVNAALLLVLTFCNAAGRRRLLQVEFRALIFLVVYVGAVRVLFLFVVRRLNVQPLSRSERSRARVRPRAVAVGAVFLGERRVVRGDVRTLGGEAGARSPGTRVWTDTATRRTGRSNLAALGQLLYTHYLSAFLRAGLVLLVARVGAIVLTRTVPSSSREAVLRQQVHQQVARDVDQAVLLTRPRTRTVGG